MREIDGGKGRTGERREQMELRSAGGREADRQC